MNRAQRREMQRQVTKIAKGKGTLKHPAPDSVTLKGGPMDGWVVKRDAPALVADWRAKFVELEAAKLYLAECERRGLREAPKWSVLSDDLRTPFRDTARLIHGLGHYERRPGMLPKAVWIAELDVDSA